MSGLDTLSIVPESTHTSKIKPDTHVDIDVKEQPGMSDAHPQPTPRIWCKLLLCSIPALLVIIASIIVLCNVRWNSGGDEQRPIFFSGVPVYNYELRHDVHNEMGGAQSKLLRGQAVYDWILELKDDADGDKIRALCSQLATARCIFKGTPSKGGLPMVVLRATQPQLESVLSHNSGLLHHAEADVTLSVAGEADAAASEIPWGLDRIDARSGLDGSYKSTLKGNGVHVYVADSGVRTTHVDFINKDGTSRAVPTLEVNADGIVECGKSEIACAADDDGHGTHVAGTIGGNTFGVAAGATLHSVKIYYGGGVGGKLGWFLAALDWVITNGERPAIVSASIVAEKGAAHESVNRAIAKATAAGIAVIVGAGNDYDDACNWTPAASPDAITVGATDSKDVKWWRSNSGPCVNMFAPGVNIMSAGHVSDTASESKTGTSMATPHVSGVAALLLEKNPSAGPAELAEQLRTHATFGALSNIYDSDNLLLYMGDEPPMQSISTTTTTTLILEIVRVAGGKGGCLKEDGRSEYDYIVFGEGDETEFSAMEGCAKFVVVGNLFRSLQHEGQCLEWYYGRNPHWGLWKCRTVHTQSLQRNGLRWCVDSNCLEEVPVTTPSFEKYYKIVTQGQCSDHPDLRSLTRKECAQGATWHLWKDQYPELSFLSVVKKMFQSNDFKGNLGKRRAAGCLMPARKGGRLRYNRMSMSEKECGAFGRSCVCMRKQIAAR